MKYAGGSLRLTDSRILAAPLVIMTGHDKDITVGRNLTKGGPLTNSFSASERAALRKYMSSNEVGCSFSTTADFMACLPQSLPMSYRQSFPNIRWRTCHTTMKSTTSTISCLVPQSGGDVFWGSENHPKPTQFKYQRGITINKRLAVVYNRKDYMCAMETVEIESRTMLRLRRSTDVHRFHDESARLCHEVWRKYGSFRI